MDKKMWSLNAMEFYLAIKMKNITSFAENGWNWILS
jgi:hypothetical protein